MGKDLVSREALERIIKRAAELQAGEHDVGDGLTNSEVLALGKDVGIPDRYLRQAMLEEQTRIVPDIATGTWAWLTGPRSIVAHRVVPGDPATVERALSRWMTDEALLQPKRHYADRTSWEPKAGAFASIQRALAGKRRYSLAQADEITAQVIQLEPGFCLVRLEADIRQQRTKRISGGTVLAVIGWGLTGATARPRAAPDARSRRWPDDRRRGNRPHVSGSQRADADRPRAGARPAGARRDSLVVQPGRPAGRANVRPHRRRSAQSLRESKAETTRLGADDRYHASRSPGVRVDGERDRAGR